MIHRWIVQQNRQRHGANRCLSAYASCFADFLKPILRGTSNASFRECGGSKLWLVVNYAQLVNSDDDIIFTGSWIRWQKNFHSESVRVMFSLLDL
jgi:hypothetical protein